MYIYIYTGILCGYSGMVLVQGRALQFICWILEGSFRCHRFGA